MTKNKKIDAEDACPFPPGVELPEKDRLRTFINSIRLVDWRVSVPVFSIGLIILVYGLLISLPTPITLPKEPMEWSKTFGGSEDDYGNSIQITSDGGYIIVGYTYSFGAGESDVYLIKTDSKGNLLWNKTYGGPKCDEARFVQETSDGGYILVGYRDEDIYLIKTDSEGNLLWNRTYGGPDSYHSGRCVQITSDGGYIIVGSTKSISSGNVDVYLIKTDSEGNMLWDKTFNKSDEDRGTFIQVTSDGGYVIVGYTKSDVYLMKTDSGGDMLWSRSFGGPKSWGYSLQVTSDGGFIISGFYGSDVYLIKTDSEGKSQWTRTYGTTDPEGNEEGYSVQVTGDGDFIVVGMTYYGFDSDIYLLKTDPDGNELYSSKYGFVGITADEGKSVQVTSDGGCIIVGGTDCNSPNVFDVYLVKIPPLPASPQVSTVDEGVPIYIYGLLIIILSVIMGWFLWKRR